MVGGCAHVPQAGEYHGANSSLGIPTLSVYRNGTVEETKGPMVGRGTWKPISDSEIKAQMHGWKQRQKRTCHYHLDPSTGTYRQITEPSKSHL